MQDFSAFKLFSIGIVSGVKARGSHLITVIPREYRFAHQELMHSNPQVNKETLQVNDKESVTTGTLDNSIPNCKWLAFNTSRKTPPDVRHGDEVLIYQASDDTFYWVEMNSADMKRKETVIYAISADPSKPLKDDYSNGYFISVSSHDKHLHVRMNQVDGEFTGYTFEVDGKAGYAQLKDDLNNTLYIDSRNTFVGFENADETLCVARKQDLFMFAHHNIELTAEDTILMKCESLIQKCVNYSCTATGSYSVDTPNAVFSTKITSPKAQLGGIEHTEHSHMEKGDGKPVGKPIEG